MKNESKTLMPTLRFPEFRQKWETKRLDAIAKLITARAGSKACTPYTVTTGVGLVSQQERFGRTIAGNAFKSYYLLRKDDFAYNKSATKAYPQGYIARFVQDEQGAVPNSIFTCFRVDPKAVAPAYLDYLFAGNLHGRWLRRYIEVSARAHGSLSVDDADLMALPVPLPHGATSLTEQRKIAACLTSLDELIAAHSGKLQALRAHKKGLMQQLFPCEGETRPRLRFPEFRNGPEWEEKEAGSLFANRTDRGEDGLPIYSVTMRDGMVKRSSFDRDFGDIEDPAGNKKACKGDISYNMMRMWQGALGVAIEDCLVSPAYVILAPQKNVVSQFFAYFFKLPASLLLLTSHSRGLTKDRLRLYYDDFARITLRCPSQPEQLKIADCLSSLDELITAQARNLDDLKTHKKGLLQQVFPSPERGEA